MFKKGYKLKGRLEYKNCACHLVVLIPRIELENAKIDLIEAHKQAMTKRLEAMKAWVIDNLAECLI